MHRTVWNLSLPFPFPVLPTILITGFTRIACHGGVIICVQYNNNIHSNNNNIWTLIIWLHVNTWPTFSCYLLLACLGYSLSTSHFYRFINKAKQNLKVLPCLAEEGYAASSQCGCVDISCCCKIYATNRWNVVRLDICPTLFCFTEWSSAFLLFSFSFGSLCSLSLKFDVGDICCTYKKQHVSVNVRNRHQPTSSCMSDIFML